MSIAVPKVMQRLDKGPLIDRMLMLVASLPFLLLLALVATFVFAAPARAEEDLTCGGHDLVGKLEADNPAEYAKLKAESDAVKNSGVRFWKVEKPGMQPSWLLGTMHLSDPRVTELPEEARAAFDAASTVVLESDEILDQQKASAALLARPDLMFFTGKETIADFLKPEEKTALEAGLLKRGMVLGAVAKMKPWIIASMVSLPTCELARKAQGKPFLDMKLARDAIASGKQVKGVETLAEQVEAMASLPMDFHVKSLVSVAKYPQYTSDMMETTLQLYLRGDIGMVMPAARYFAPAEDAAEYADMAVFEQKLITDRNHHMADRGDPILSEGNVFMAVGALHLTGDEGVVELLRRKGYTLTPAD